MDGRQDLDAGEFRTGAGSLQLDRRNPELVVFYNLRPGPDDVLSRGKEDLSGRALGLGRLQSSGPSVSRVSGKDVRVAVQPRLRASGFGFIYSAGILHPALSNQQQQQPEAQPRL